MTDFRPATWDGYVGQRKLKDRLQIHIAGSIEHDEQLDHVLLVGPPGCGKTTIASLIAQELGDPFESYIMPIKPQVLRRLVMSYVGVVLFDEIHRLTPRQQEDLLPLVEDDYLQLDNGTKLFNYSLTIIGATTEPEKVIPPLYDRFQIKPPWDDYKDDEMGLILSNMATKMGVEFTNEEAELLGRAAGGVPRNAKSIVSMARDLDSTDVDLILHKCRLSRDGLTEMHRRYIKVLKECGGVAGLDIIGAHLRLPKSILVDLERLLMQRQMIEYTKQGRSLLSAGYKV
jgi:holliday junction DNA helicase RuvB